MVRLQIGTWVVGEKGRGTERWGKTETHAQRERGRGRERQRLYGYHTEQIRKVCVGPKRCQKSGLR